MNVSPTMSQRYTLAAYVAPLTKQLGSVTVEVDTQRCLFVSIPEQDVRDAIEGVVDSIISKRSEIKRRRLDVIEIDGAGIHINLALKALLNGPNPNVNISADIRLYAAEGRPRYSLYRFQVDLDFPFWANALMGTVLPLWFAKMIAENSAERGIRHEIEQALKDILRTIQSALDAYNFGLLSLSSRQDEINYTACPK